MAENEIVKHVESALKAAKNPDTHWLHKLKEVLIEIIIIVFAVTISIWFHNWSDSIHQHKEEREFLTGLKNDVAADTAVAKGDSAFYSGTLIGLKYFQRVAAGEPLVFDSLKVYQYVFFSNVNLDPHISRYEGLKGSGKFGIIENTDLLNNIINLHEVTIKHLESLDGYYVDFSSRLGNFIQQHGQLNQNNNAISNAQDVLRIPEMRFLLRYGASLISDNIFKAHDSCIAQCQRIIRQIDTELQ